MSRVEERKRPEGLQDDEAIVALIRVRFTAGLPTNIDTAATASRQRKTMVQRHAYAHWARSSSAAGFPIGGPEMFLGITKERLLVWRPALIWSRPGRFAGAVPLTNIRSAGVHRQIVSSVLTLLFESGSLVAMQTVRGGKLRAFAAHIPSYLDPKAR